MDRQALKMKLSMLLNIGLAFCLVATLLFTAETMSDRSSGSREYDPWLDYNEDGIIDMADISMNIEAFMTTGNPAKNVTVTNWPITLNVSIIPTTLNLTLAINRDVGTSGHWYTQEISGYRQATVGIHSFAIPARLIVKVYWIIGGVELLYHEWSLASLEDVIETFIVQSEVLKIYVATDQGSGSYSLGLYATT